MRDDDPHEADEAAHRDDRGRSQRRRDHEREPHALHAHAQARRLVVPEVQHVDHTAQREDHDRRDGDVRQHEPDVRPAGRRDVPEDPRVDLLERVRVPLLDERLPRREERRHGDAGEDERRGVALAPGRAADRVGEEDGRDPADERGGGQDALAAQALRAGTRSRPSRRDRRPQRRRAGTGPRVGSGRRPGTSRPRARASRRRSRRARRAARGSPTGSPPRSRTAATPRAGRASRRRLEDRAEAEVDRAGEDADRERDEEERDRRAGPERGQSACADLAPLGLRGGRFHGRYEPSARAPTTSRGRSSRAAGPSGTRSSRPCARSSPCGRR